LDSLKETLTNNKKSTTSKASTAAESMKEMLKTTPEF
jgi:hypothetical protein